MVSEVKQTGAIVFQKMSHKQLLLIIPLVVVFLVLCQFKNFQHQIIILDAIRQAHVVHGLNSTYNDESLFYKVNIWDEIEDAINGVSFLCHNLFILIS